VLSSHDFRAKIGALTTPRASRRYLLRSPEVWAVRDAIRHGQISEDSIRSFADGLMEEFHRGIQFPHEVALAALATVLEQRKTNFAEDFLIDLAKLRKIAEMDIAPRIAALSLQQWHKAPKSVKRNASFESRFTLQFASRGMVWKPKPTGLLPAHHVIISWQKS
jgi:hypothetical protein